jgi:hypothetical protein
LLAARESNKQKSKSGLAEWSFAIPEVASYLQGDGPLDMHIPQKAYKVATGV